MANKGVALIIKYFTGLSDIQIAQFDQLEELYTEWNSRINVISRKDIDGLYVRHILHSLGIAKVISFNSEAKILDIGTGGGLPGIPLAILFPESQFILVDSIGKKIKVVTEIAQSLHLQNVKAVYGRGEEIKGEFDFVVSRAVTKMKPFYQWTKGKLKKESSHQIKNGILYLKGGDLATELETSGVRYIVHELSDFFKEAFFDAKRIVYVERQ